MKKAIILLVMVAFALGLAIQAGAESQTMVKPTFKKEMVQKKDNTSQKDQTKRKPRKPRRSDLTDAQRAALNKAYQAFRKDAAPLFKDRRNIEKNLRALLSKKGFDQNKAKSLVDKLYKVDYKINLKRNEHMAKVKDGLGFRSIKRRLDRYYGHRKHKGKRPPQKGGKSMNQSN